MASCGSAPDRTAVGAPTATPEETSTTAHGDTSYALAEPLVTPEVGATLSPPPPGARASVDEATARSNLEKVVGPLPPSFTPKLAVYSNTTYGEIQENGTVKPQYLNKLVWAYIAREPYEPSKSGGMVGPDGGPKQAKLPAGTMCDGVWLADAGTGEYLMGYSGCPVDRIDRGTPQVAP